MIVSSPSLSSFGNMFDRDADLLREKSEDGEDDAGGDERRDEVQGGDDGGVDVDFVVEFVVRTEHH